MRRVDAAHEPCSRRPPSRASMTRTAIALLGLVVVLVGCLAVVRPEAKREGDLLLASGFETRAADTPERIRHLESLPPLRMVPHVEDGRSSSRWPTPTAASASTSATRRRMRRTASAPSIGRSATSRRRRTWTRRARDSTGASGPRGDGHVGSAVPGGASLARVPGASRATRDAGAGGGLVRGRAEHVADAGRTVGVGKVDAPPLPESPRGANAGKCPLRQTRHQGARPAPAPTPRRARPPDARPVRGERRRQPPDAAGLGARRPVAASAGAGTHRRRARSGFPRPRWDDPVRRREAARDDRPRAAGGIPKRCCSTSRPRRSIHRTRRWWWIRSRRCGSRIGSRSSSSPINQS